MTLDFEPFVGAGTRITYLNKTYTIVKVNPKNLVLRDEAGGRFNLPRTAKYQVVKVDLDAPVVSTVVRAPSTGFFIGAVVRVKPEERPSLGRKFTYPEDQAFVVIKVGYDMVNVAKMGGEGGRYWRMDPRGLDIVKVG